MLNFITYPIFIFVSIFFPRNKKIWVFGCYDGYLDNTKYFFEYSSKKNEYDCYWLANNHDERLLVESLGFRSVLKKTPRGFWLSSRAYFSFICTGYSDVNRLLALSGNVINFWHGTPIKKIFLDSHHDLNRFGDNKIGKLISTTMLKFLVSRYSFYYASNELERKLICNASGLPLEKSLTLGAPRFDNIRYPQESKALLNIKKKYKKIFLYAPTWRESGTWASSFKISSAQYSGLINMLNNEDAILIIKNHPLTDVNEIKGWGLNPSERVIYSTDIEILDINTIYTHADALITDVSSSMFDYLIFKRPIILFMPDVKEYIKGHRGIYSYFKSFLLENALLSWSELIKNTPNAELEGQIFSDIAQKAISHKNTNENIYNDLVTRFLKPKHYI